MRSKEYDKREQELLKEYMEFLGTDKGKEWAEFTKNNSSEGTYDFGYYLYDFHPEMLM